MESRVLLVLVQPPQQSVAVLMADPPPATVAEDPTTTTTTTTTTMTYQVVSPHIFLVWPGTVTSIDWIAALRQSPHSSHFYYHDLLRPSNRSLEGGDHLILSIDKTIKQCERQTETRTLRPPLNSLTWDHHFRLPNCPPCREPICSSWWGNPSVRNTRS